MEPSSIQRVVTVALAQISGVAHVEGGDATSEPEPDGEESPESSDSEASEPREIQTDQGEAKRELRDGEWVRVGDEWVVHHR
eukprot:14202049-Alexandrium_andersonii.AAC.1